MKNPLPIDAVLTGAKPRLTEGDAVAIGATLFGVAARAPRATSAASATGRSSWSTRAALRWRC